MGCGSSHSINRGLNPEYVVVTKAWDRVWDDMGMKKGTKVNVKNEVVRRIGWKTIRIFISSTFKDFHQEREVLIKKVFPDLRMWCEQHRLHLIECDLRWGVPKDVNTEDTLRACLGEIDRCYADNSLPFFLNMTSERVGWVPTKSQIPDSIMEEYRWIDGMSVTEMEILHAAYRIDNPNAIFMLRKPKFLETVPKEYQQRFSECTSSTGFKLDLLKEMISARFPKNRIRKYDVTYRGYNPDTNVVEVDGLDEYFSTAVFDFFKDRISSQYPLPDTKANPFEVICEQHESFSKNRGEAVFGRAEMLKQVMDHINNPGQDVPFLLVGGAGTGKSSIMARITEDTTTNAHLEKISGIPKNSSYNKWLVFYHFVGAVPGSTELEALLRRLLFEMEVTDKSKMLKNLDDVVGTVNAALTSLNVRPTIIIVDALNQLDNDRAAEMVSWVPSKLAPQVRCIFSVIPGTPQHTALLAREPAPKVLLVNPLDLETRKLIVTETLGKYRKRLDAQQMASLLAKESSANPLWLSLAVEELRVFGLFRKILDKINQLEDGLLELEIQIIERFERESNPTLLVATLCLLEVSSRGLLETELLAMLGDEDHLTRPKGDTGDKDADTEKENSKPTAHAHRPLNQLAAYKWADVYRNLKPFLRPFGESGEGRLDFYHRSLSKSVRRKYFRDQNGEEDKELYKFWHTKLADFFEESKNFHRKLEEYPVHLLVIDDHLRLTAYLTDWDVFEALFVEDFSTRLIKLWRMSVGFETMEEMYFTALKNFANSGESKRKVHQRKIILCRYFAQAGRFTAAEQLVKEAIRVEQEEFNAGDAEMAELYHLTATIQDEIMKMEEYMYRSQLPQMKQIIGNFEASAALHKKLPGERHKKQLGLIKNRLAFYYTGYFLRNGDSWLTADGAKEKAIATIEEAIEIFTEMNDLVNMADCLTTKGVTYGNAEPAQLKCYKEAEELLLRAVEEHQALDRLYLNIGIYYEEIGHMEDALVYFLKWYHLSISIYGKEHPRALRSIKVLREPAYRRLLTFKDISIPELPTEK